MTTISHNQLDLHRDLIANLHRYTMGLGVVKNSVPNLERDSGFGIIKPRQISSTETELEII